MPDRFNLTSGPVHLTPPPHQAGVFRVRPKNLARHVAELDALAGADLDDIIATSRAAVDTRLDLARTEVMLNVWTVRDDAHP